MKLYIPTIKTLNVRVFNILENDLSKLGLENENKRKAVTCEWCIDGRINTKNGGNGWWDHVPSGARYWAMNFEAVVEQNHFGQRKLEFIKSCGKEVADGYAISANSFEIFKNLFAK